MPRRGASAGNACSFTLANGSSLTFLNEREHDRSASFGGFDLRLDDGDDGIRLVAGSASGLRGSSMQQHAAATRRQVDIVVPQPKPLAAAALAALERDVAAQRTASPAQKRRARFGSTPLQLPVAAASGSGASSVVFFPILAAPLPPPHALSPALETPFRAVSPSTWTSEDVFKLLQQDDLPAFQTWWRRASGMQLADFEHRCEGSILLSVAQLDSVHIAHFLLADGICVESADRQYTALMLAVEYQASECLVQLLLRHGANLTGEFAFNAETPLTLSRFKACAAIARALKTLRNIPKPALPVPLAGLWIAACRCRTCSADASSFSLLQCLERSLQQHTSFLKASEAHGDTPWRFCALPAVEKLLLPVFFQLASLHQLLCAQPAMAALPAKLWNTAEVEHALTLTHALNRVHSAIVHTGPSSSSASASAVAASADAAPGQPTAMDAESNALLTGDLSGLICQSRQVRLAAELPGDLFTRSGLQVRVSELNRQLATHSSLTVDGLLISEFRGLHYYDHHFTPDARALHQQSTHLNRLAPAPALFPACGRIIAQWQLTRESALRSKGDAVKDIMRTLAQMPSATHAHQAHQRQEQMSNDYAGWAVDMGAGADDVSALFYQEQLLGYPHVAHSELPDHALRYCLGEKSIGSLSQHRRLPFYDVEGRARHVFLGKLFVTLCTPQQLADEQTTKPLEAHNRQQMHLNVAVAPEREIAQPGCLSAGRMFHEQLLTAPSFHHAKMPPGYAQLYGYSAAEYRKERTVLCAIGLLERMDPVRLKEETRVLARVRKHMRAELMRTAGLEARRRGSQLVFMHSRLSYGLYPEPLRVIAQEGTFNLSADERNMLRELDHIRFPSEKPNQQKEAQLAQEATDVLQLQAEMASEGRGGSASAAGAAGDAAGTGSAACASASSL